MPKSRSRKLVEYGLLFAILSPIFSSIATIFQSGATKTLSPLIVSSVGGILGCVFLFALIFLTGEHRFLNRAKKNSGDLAKVTIIRAILGQLLIATGLAMTSGVKAIFFTKIEPYFILIFNWIFRREKIYPKQFVLLTIHLIGVIILSTSGIFIFSMAQLGDLLIIIAMILFASSYTICARLSKNIGAKISNAITMGAGGLIILPFALTFSPSVAWASPAGWEYLLSYVILFNVIALTLWYAALKSVKGWIVSALRAIGPLAGVPFAYFMFGETLTIIQFVGAAIVLITSALIVRENKVEKKVVKKKRKKHAKK